MPVIPSIARFSPFFLPPFLEFSDLGFSEKDGFGINK
jgi:hypothetical protein